MENAVMKRQKSVKRKDGSIEWSGRRARGAPQNAVAPNTDFISSGEVCGEGG